MLDLGLESGFGNDWLKFMTLKIMGDGSGAGGTAGVYEPQHRGPKGLGLMMTDPAVIEELVVKAKEAGSPPLGVEGAREGERVLVDLNDVIVHNMLPQTRAFYNLEKLWEASADHRSGLSGSVQ